MKVVSFVDEIRKCRLRFRLMQVWHDLSEFCPFNEQHCKLHGAIIKIMVETGTTNTPIFERPIIVLFKDTFIPLLKAG